MKSHIPVRFNSVICNAQIPSLKCTTKISKNNALLTYMMCTMHTLVIQNVQYNFPPLDQPKWKA